MTTKRPEVWLACRAISAFDKPLVDNLAQIGQ